MARIKLVPHDVRCAQSGPSARHPDAQFVRSGLKTGTMSSFFELKISLNIRSITF